MENPLELPPESPKPILPETGTEDKTSGEPETIITPPQTVEEAGATTEEKPEIAEETEPSSLGTTDTTLETPSTDNAMSETGTEGKPQEKVGLLARLKGLFGGNNKEQEE